MNPYSDIHKNLSTTELLDIINNPQDYEPLAVTSAHEELSNRNLSQEVIQTEKEKYKQIEQNKAVQKEYLQQQTNSITEKVVHYFLILLHGKSKQRSQLTIINGISILIFINAITPIVKSFFVYGEYQFRYSGMVGYFLLTVIIPAILLIIISLQLRKQTILGWVGANIVLFISLSAIVIDFMQSYLYSNQLTLMYIPKPDPVKSFILIALTGAGIVFLNKKDIYPQFKISTKIRNVVLATLSLLVVVASIFALI
ncbi:MAG: hypothetical protein IPI65_11215 [Bacteroidetes bacterium]|nr:hypothetical protein [Bacteroidota bacterium]